MMTLSWGQRGQLMVLCILAALVLLGLYHLVRYLVRRLEERNARRAWREREVAAWEREAEQDRARAASWRQQHGTRAPRSSWD